MYKLFVILFITISGWIATFRVRRRMKRVLGRKTSDIELTSLKTWMQVDEAEERNRQSGPIHPR
jgi:hypothetical protein